MAQNVIHRPARARVVEPTPAALELHPAPPSGTRGGNQNAAQLLMPLLGGAGSMIMIVTNRNPVMLIAGSIMLGATVLGGAVMFLLQKSGAARRGNDQRQRYLAYLDRMRAEIGQATAVQRDYAVLQHPAPEDLPEIARSSIRIWERRPGDADFLTVRVGRGSSPLWQQVVAPRREDPLAEPDIVVAAAIHRLLDRDRMVHGMPVAVPLSGRVSMLGPIDQVQATITAMLAQLVTWHSPDDVRLYAYSPRHSANWLNWLKWLPHVLSTTDTDGNGPQRQVASTPDELTALIRDELARRANLVARSMRGRGVDPSVYGPAMVIVVDNPGGRPLDPLAGLPADLNPARLGMHIIAVAQHPNEELGQIDVRVRCGADGIEVEDLRPLTDDPLAAARQRAKGAAQGTPDRVDPGTLQALARELTAVRLVEEQAAGAPLESVPGLVDFLGVADVATFDPQLTWAPRTASNFLRVPFGIGAAGELVLLDLKEPALGGMGPHGLCVGATGSGKSEVLRTIVLTQAIAHPADRLALVLVDYKGGATFAGLEDLPHCAAMISNLSDDDGLVDRLHDALFGEMKRRQQVLAAAGNLPNITEYNRRRDLGEPLAELPNLLVVIDEFGELLTAKPDFIELFLAIGRIGRSIGIHLLLASQRLEEGRLRGLESFLSYRLGLRTFNAGESRTVLGVPDAYELPPIPGSGYLKVDTSVFQRFKAAYVSGPYVAPATGVTEIDTDPVVAPFPLFNDVGRYLRKRDDSESGAERQPTEDAVVPSVLEVAVRRLAAAGHRTGQIWLPPLPARLSLDEVIGTPQLDPQDGLVPPRLADVESRTRLPIPVGLLDRPAEQKQEPLVIDLAGSGGHLVILGAPQTGKSTFLRTLLLSACLHYRPGEIALYILDLGGSLRALADLPQVAGVAARLDPDRIRRSIAEVGSMLAEREQLFARLGIDSVEAMRQRFREGRLAELDVADVFLVVDNYAVLKSEFDDLTDAVNDIAGRGPGYGIHLIITAGRWADLRMGLQASLGIKVEFRLNDPGESSIARKASANLRADAPGRCIVGEGLQAQVCLPQTRIDVERADAGAAVGAMESLIDRIATGWTGPRVPALRTLPVMITQADLADAAGPTAGVVIAIDENQMRPLVWECFGAEPHLLVIGDAESGKTALLRALCADLVGRKSDDEVVFVVFDIRRTLLDFIPESHLGAYAGTAAAAAGTAAAIAGELSKRLPPDTVTAAELRTRSWWKGPEIFVLVDDYDLLVPGGGNPLAPFIAFLPQARDIGFHLVLARRSGGAGRAMHEPLIQRLRESGAAALLLSGDRSEGALFPGATMSAQPPGRGLLVRRGRRPTVVQVGYRGDAPIEPGPGAPQTGNMD